MKAIRSTKPQLNEIAPSNISIDWHLGDKATVPGSALFSAIDNVVSKPQKIAAQAGSCWKMLLRRRRRNNPPASVRHYCDRGSP
jgi:hypothetical protein